MPRFTGSGSTLAPAASATAAVASVEPSSTTSTSSSGPKSRSSATTSAIDAASLKAGTMARQRGASRCASAAGSATTLITLPVSAVQSAFLTSPQYLATSGLIARTGDGTEIIAGVTTGVR